MHQVCRELHDLIGDGAAPFALWRRLVGCGLRGLHIDGALWLHALVGMRQIASYVEQARHFTLLTQLCFHTDEELVAVQAALDGVVNQHMVKDMQGASGDAIAAGLWHFDPRDLDAFFASNSAVNAVSSLVACQCSGQGLVFNVTLVLERLAGSDRNNSGFNMAWESSFVTEVLLEALDYVEIELSGSVLGLSSHGSATQHIPQRGLAPAAPVLPGSATHQALLHATPLTCLLHVSLRVSGEQEQVTLARKGHRHSPPLLGALRPECA